MSHSKGSDTDQERVVSVFISVFLSFPIWKMELNNSICPTETDPEDNSGNVPSTVSRRNMSWRMFVSGIYKLQSAAITTITILITGFSRCCSTSFQPDTHTNTAQESSRLVWSWDLKHFGQEQAVSIRWSQDANSVVSVFKFCSSMAAPDQLF